MTIQTACLGKKLWACVEKLDQGWNIGLYGGDSSHVGAVTFADKDGIQTMQRSGHKDELLSLRWAKYLFERLERPICVRCGVHFDWFSKEDLPAILDASDRLIEQVERMIG